MARHYIPNPVQPALDDDRFPVVSDDTLDTLFVSDWEVIYHCGLIRGMGMLGWRQVGRLG